MESDYFQLILKIRFAKHVRFCICHGFQRYILTLSQTQDEFNLYNDRLIVPLFTNSEREATVTNLLVSCPAEEKSAWIISNLAFLLEK